MQVLQFLLDLDKNFANFPKDQNSNNGGSRDKEKH